MKAVVACRPAIWWCGRTITIVPMQKLLSARRTLPRWAS